MLDPSTAVRRAPLEQYRRAPFPYFGGKRSVARDVWQRLGHPKQYIEPFCGSAAMLLLSRPASLEVVNDVNGFIANFWRAVKHQPIEVARAADYPVSHIDLGARHKWLMGQRDMLAAELHDPDWPGSAKVAGWWLWGQCSWIGSGWCEWSGKIPHAGNAGKGIQASGQIPHAGNAGQGIQASGQIPHAGNAGKGIQASGQIPHAGNSGAMLTSAGRTAHVWLAQLSERLERVRVTHGDWDRCLNSHYGGDKTAVFLDPPYLAYETLYGVGAEPVARSVAEWASANQRLRVALCGHVGDYDLPGWEVVKWSRPRPTYGKSIIEESIWFSPGCDDGAQGSLF